MGSFNSRRRRNMDSNEGAAGGGGGSGSGSGTGGSGAGGQGGSGRGSGRGTGTSDDVDLSTILSYLIRSGQVRILAPGGADTDRVPEGDEDLMDDDFYDDLSDDGIHPVETPRPDPHPDTTTLEMNELQQRILLDSGQCTWGSSAKQSYKCCDVPYAKTSVPQMLQKREVGINGRQHFSQGDCSVVNSYYLPNHWETLAHYHHKAFCGTYSQQGGIFLTAWQDRNIRIYDTTKGFDNIKTISARDVGWSVLDTSFSPDENYLVYSSWSEYIHLCSIYSEHDIHTALPLCPDSDQSFCIFSLTFSQDNKEIMGGANDNCLYVYDREINSRTLQIRCHSDDVNAVAFADASSQILFSGSDDGLCKVWDRRTLSEENPIPVGVLAGHCNGITFIESKGDARYLISNSKDQTIKLWDIRHFSSKDTQEVACREVYKQRWDYRWQQVPRKVMKQKSQIPGDSSLMTYRGHCVLNTLVRCRFSPAHSTGQQYIYTGCATGAVIIYDVLTGHVVKKLDKCHRACVRDVSWHPFENKIISTSWDGTISLWTYNSGDNTEDWVEEQDSDSDSDSGSPRRSKRLQDRNPHGDRNHHGNVRRFVFS